MNIILNQTNIDSFISNIVYEEQRKLEFEEKYELMSEDARKIFHELYEMAYPETKGQLNEGNWLNVVGDVVGIFDPTGLVDIANGISYLYQGDTFFGMLSLISAIPYAGDVVAKPLMLAGRGSKIIKDTNFALKAAKAGKTAEASKIIKDVANYNSFSKKFFGTIRNWAPKLKNLVDKIPGGKLSSGLKNTVKDAISLFEKAGSGAQKASSIARRASKKTLTNKEAIDILQQMQKAVKSDARLFRDFGGASAKGLKGMKNYKMSGMPRLIGNKAVRSLVTRTKFWAGFLDWLGVANFVGPDELKAQMGPEFDNQFNKYSQSEQAQKNWDTEFGGADVNEPTTADTSSEPSTASKAEDMGKSFLKDLIFGPLTGKMV
jgi:hypothetical protein